MAESLMHIAMIIAMLAVLVAGIRFVLGPSAADRTVALDALTIISTSLIVFIALYSGRSVYFDVAMVYAILSFIGVIAVARYLEGGL
ncbi:MAG TPA: cation:proton antiporter [Caldithrix abyssi]|uniref:Cation:proton antiporter n=1 Tax=Caldithrix abyssi TaxID=187145 RepID=A0A7V5H2S4_CALAY|nr:cation:proton antiporter [Caldithrix abyssi]